MLRALLYGILLGCALILSAWMGMADAKSSAKRHSELRITAPVAIRTADPENKPAARRPALRADSDSR